MKFTAFAAGGVDFSTPAVFAPVKHFNDVGTIVTMVLKNAFVLAGLIFFVMIIAGGFTMITGAGSSDPHKTEQGLKAVTGAVVGLLLVVLSFLIMQVITYITGLDILKTLFQL